MRLTLTAFGRTVALCADPRRIALARAVLPDVYVSTDDQPECCWTLGLTDSGWDVLVDGVAVPGLGRPDEDMAWGAAVSHLEMWVAEHAEVFTFVHAGCAVIDRQAIIVPAYSMSGKSTLIAALIRAGAEYFSDELVVLDADGRVHPYRRPLAIRGADGKIDRVPVTPPVGTGWTDSADVAVVAMLMYHPVEGWHASSLSSPEALLHLLPHVMTTRTRPADTLATASRVVAGATTLYGTRDDAGPAARRLMQIARDANGRPTA